MFIVDAQAIVLIVILGIPVGHLRPTTPVLRLRLLRNQQTKKNPRKDVAYPPATGWQPALASRAVCLGAALQVVVQNLSLGRRGHFGAGSGKRSVPG